MPYSKRKKTVYVWIPKTAGTSMVNAFKKRKVFTRNGREDLWGRIPEEEREQRKAANWQHISALGIIEELGQKTWDDSFTFTIVRNPYDRLVSFYEYSRAARKDPRSVQYGLPELGSFDEWLDQEQPLGQLHYVADENGKVLVDFVGRYESLKQDVFKICIKMKMLPIRLPRLNTSERRDYKSYFTPESRKRVEEHYGDELACFNYDF